MTIEYLDLADYIAVAEADAAVLAIASGEGEAATAGWLRGHLQQDAPVT